MFESYEDILTIQDVADILKVGTTQVYKIVELKAFKEGKDWKIAKPALVEYVGQKRRLW